MFSILKLKKMMFSQVFTVNNSRLLFSVWDIVSWFYASKVSSEAQLATVLSQEIINLARNWFLLFPILAVKR